MYYKYVLTLEEEDFPYPVKVTIEFSSLEEAFKYLGDEFYKRDYEFVSLARKED